MIRKLIVPAELGDVEVRLLDWLKAEGDSVSVGDALLEFETDKAIVMVTASEAGVLRRILVAVGDWMKPGDVVAWLSTEPDEALDEAGSPDADVLPVTFDAT